MKTAARRRRAFSLTEMLVVLAVAAALTAAGVPQLAQLLARQRLRCAATDLFAAIDLTRSQAIARGTRVLLAPADPAGSDWARGWVVFVDRNGNRRPDAADELIFRQGPLGPGIAIRTAFSSSLAPAYVAYNGAGRSCSAANSLAARWGTLSVALGNSVRHIKINMLGRVRICDPQAQPRDCSGADDG